LLLYLYRTLFLRTVLFPQRRVPAVLLNFIQGSLAPIFSTRLVSLAACPRTFLSDSTSKKSRLKFSLWLYAVWLPLLVSLLTQRVRDYSSGLQRTSLLASFDPYFSKPYSPKRFFHCKGPPYGCCLSPFFEDSSLPQLLFLYLASRYSFGLNFDLTPAVNTHRASARGFEACIHLLPVEPILFWKDVRLGRWY